MSWLGLDIGGANLKAADGRGWARSVPFPLWLNPNGLADALVELIACAPSVERIVVTMTGELCDAFRTKAEGVRHILSAVHQAAGGREVRVYLVDGRIVSVEEVRQAPHLAAASNWHALASFACRFLDGGSGLLIDIGSTTTDIVSIVEGEPRPRGLTDTERLLAGELVYTGVGRTPICAITPWLPWRGQRCPVAAELFATAADAYVLLGELEEQPNCDSTADGRPLTKQFCRERLARMVCADAETFSWDDARQAAIRVKEAQLDLLRTGQSRVLSHSPKEVEGLVVSGRGEFLAKIVASEIWPGSKIVQLAAVIGPIASQCGPAHALAVLAQEAV